MPNNPLRIAPALRAFPTLQRHRILPRNLAAVPIGKADSTIDDHDVPTCLSHLYYDLGVLVFAGCNPDQVRRIGNVLEQAVRSGGPGRLSTQLQHAGSSKLEQRTETARWTRLAPLGPDDVSEPIGDSNTRMIKPQAVLRLASEAFRGHIEERATESGLDMHTIQIREQSAHVDESLPLQSILYHTVGGTRYLPIDAHTAVDIDNRRGVIRCNAQFFSGGSKQELCGSCRIDYALRLDPPPRMTGHGNTVKEESNGAVGRRDSNTSALRDLVCNTLFRELWDLEREIYPVPTTPALEDKGSGYDL